MRVVRVRMRRVMVRVRDIVGRRWGGGEMVGCGLWG